MAAAGDVKVSSLLGAVVGLAEWRESLEAQLLSIVDTARGGKLETFTLVVDPPLLSVLRLILSKGVTSLTERLMDPRGILKLSSAPIEPTTSTVIFLLRPSVQAARCVSLQLQHARKRGGKDWAASVCFVPRRSLACETIWVDDHVADMLSSIAELNAPLVPWDDDLLSMEWPNIWADARLTDDPSAAHHVAGALLALQEQFGPIPDIKAKGTVAEQAVSLMLKRRRQQDDESRSETDAATVQRGGTVLVPPPPPNSLIASALRSLDTDSASDPTSLRVAGLGAAAAAATAAAAGGSRGSGSGAAAAAAAASMAASSDDAAGSGTGPIGSGSGGAGAGGGSTAGVIGSGGRVVTGGQIHVAIVIDRDVDPVTPLVHALTLEALVDDLIGLEAGRVSMAEEVLVGKDDSASASAMAGRAAGPGGLAMPPPGGRQVELALNTNDRLWTRIRDCHILSASERLDERAVELKRHEDRVATLRQEDVEVVKAFINTVSEHNENKKVLRRLMNLYRAIDATTKDDAFMEEWDLMLSAVQGEQLKRVRDTIERLIGERASKDCPHRALRLLCLLSAVEGGLLRKDIDAWRSALMHSYGVDGLFSLDILERLGLLIPKEGGGGLFGVGGSGPSDWKWDVLRKSLRLINLEVNCSEPRDVAYVTSGLAPLSVRLVQAALSIPIGQDALLSAINSVPAGELSAADFAPFGGWSLHHAELAATPGPALELRQLQGGNSIARHVGISAKTPSTSASSRAAGASNAASSASESGGGPSRRVVLVFFLGGVTFAEVASLRLLAEMLPFDFLIATTHVTSGRKIMEQAWSAAQLHEVELRPPPRAA